MEHLRARRRSQRRPTKWVSAACIGVVAAVVASGCAPTQPAAPEPEVLLLRTESPASAGSDAAALAARIEIVADRCVGAVASGRTYLIRFPSDTSWDGETLVIPGSQPLGLGDDVTFGGSGSALDLEGRDTDVPAVCASAADEIWYVGGARLD